MPNVKVAQNAAKKPAKKRQTKATQNEFMDEIMGGAMGGAGATMLDVVMGFIPTPEEFKPAMPLIKGAVSLGLGWALDQTGLVKPETSKRMVEGMLSVNFNQVINSGLTNMFPNLTLGEYVGMGTYEGPWQPDMGEADYLGYFNTNLNLGPDTSMPYIEGNEESLFRSGPFGMGAGMNYDSYNGNEASLI
jgi:hypothetical protein